MTISRALRRVLYAVLAVLVLTGFAVQFYLLFTGGADVNSGEAGDSVPLATRFVRLFSFFTVDSNVLALIVCVLIVLRRDTGGALWRVVSLATLLSLTVTGTAFSLLLDPSLELRGAAVIVNNIFHILSPAMFAALWLLWGPRRQLNPRVIALAFLWPVAWLVYTFLHGALTGWYPYAILDAGKVGLGPAILNSLLVLGYAVLLTGVVFAIDRWAPALPVAPGTEAENSLPEVPQAQS